MMRLSIRVLRTPLTILSLIVASIGCASDTGNATTASPSTASLEPTVPAAATELAVLAPRTGYGIYDADDCALLVGAGLAEPVPVASVFKLWVLDAVARSIASGDITWETPVAIRDSLRSDPSGEAYGYPDGRQVPLHQLTELMITISDNTATDHLIDLVGRDAIGEVIRELAPDGAARTLPLLTTADMARLKFVHPDLGREYADLASPARAAFLANLPERGPFPWPEDPTAINRLDLTTPSLIDEVEWYASGTDICRTMSHLVELAQQNGLEPLDEILSANPGLTPAQAQAWTTKWFKGGSEPGVLTLAYRLAVDNLDRIVVIALSDPDKPLTQHADGQQVIESILNAARE